MKYKLVPTNTFKKDVLRLLKRGKDISKLEKVIEDLSNDVTLDRKYCDHKLKGNLKKYRECHIEPDWCLMYEKDKNKLYLYLLKTGRHSDFLTE